MTHSISIRSAAQKVYTNLENEIGGNGYPETTAKAIEDLESYLRSSNSPDSLIPFNELAFIYKKASCSEDTQKNIYSLLIKVTRKRQESKANEGNVQNL